MPKAALMSTCLALAAMTDSSSANFVELWPPIEVSELVLKDPAVLEYLHLDQPGRQPLIVSSTLSHPDLELLALGYAIKLVPGDSPAASNAFQFTKAKWSEDHATVEFSFPPEGLRGRFKFLRSAGRWTISARKLWEQ
jgi:hypothetical protein